MTVSQSKRMRGRPKKGPRSSLWLRPRFLPVRDEGLRPFRGVRFGQAGGRRSVPKKERLDDAARR